MRKRRRREKLFPSDRKALKARAQSDAERVEQAAKRAATRCAVEEWADRLIANPPKAEPIDLGLLKLLLQPLVSVEGTS